MRPGDWRLLSKLMVQMEIGHANDWHPTACLPHRTLHRSKTGKVSIETYCVDDNPFWAHAINKSCRASRLELDSIVNDRAAAIVLWPRPHNRG